MQPTIKLTPECDAEHTICSRFTNEINLICPRMKLSPELEISIENLDLDKKYIVSLHFEVMGAAQLVYNDGKWTAGEPIEIHDQQRVHCLKPATGREWMQRPVTFHDLKISLWNSVAPGKDSSTIFLHINHKYIPVISIHELLPDASTNLVHSIQFPHTAFIPVKKYNNKELKSWKRSEKLKISVSTLLRSSSSQSSASTRSSVSSSQLTSPFPARQLPVILNIPVPGGNIRILPNPNVYISLCTISLSTMGNLVFIKTPPVINPTSIVITHQTDDKPLLPLAVISLHEVSDWIIDYFEIQKLPNYPNRPTNLTNSSGWLYFHVQLWQIIPDLFTLDVLNLIYSDKYLFFTS